MDSPLAFDLAGSEGSQDAVKKLVSGFWFLVLWDHKSANQICEVKSVCNLRHLWIMILEC